MHIACSTASFPADSLERALSKIAWAGYRGAELDLAAEPLPPEAAVRRRLVAEGLEPVAVAAGPLPSTQDVEGLARIGRRATFARSIDAPLVVVTAPSTGDLPELVATLCLLDRALGNLPVALALRHAPDTVLRSPDDYRQLWRIAELPGRCGIALDPCAAILAGWDPAETDVLPVLPRHIYLTDARDDRPVPLGEGMLGAIRLLDGLRQAEFAGTLVLELAGADPWAVEPTAREIQETVSALLV